MEIDEELAPVFQRGLVRDLQNEDFALATTDGITLFATGCSIILFYDNTLLSRQLMEIWLDLAQIHAGVNFYGVDFNNRREIMQRFFEIKTSPNHMFNRYTTQAIPFILVYREDQPGISYPQAFYNGPLTTDDISNWILIMACQPGYRESPLLAKGITTPNNTIINDPNMGEGVTRVLSSDVDPAVSFAAISSRRAREEMDRQEKTLLKNYALDLAPTKTYTDAYRKKPTRRGVGFITF